MVDPMESQIKSALEAGRHWYSDDPRKTGRLDFHVKWGADEVFIEVKQFHSERIAGQMASAPNVIAVQGAGAVRFMSALLRAVYEGVPDHRIGAEVADE